MQDIETRIIWISSSGLRDQFSLHRLLPSLVRRTYILGFSWANPRNSRHRISDSLLRSGVNMHRTLLLLGILSLQAFSQQIPLERVEEDAQCRCRPNDPCWPSPADWDALNGSIHGNLVRVRPVGYVCHEPTYNKIACEHVSAMSPSGVWRASEPGKSVPTRSNDR